MVDVVKLGDPAAEIVLVQTIGEHELGTIKNEIDLIRENVQADFGWIGLQVEDWNRDLSPWEAPPVFGREGFGGQAEKTLAEVLEYCRDDGKKYVIGGYSLAGLFALWAASKTDLFRGVAAASPSVWFPGFDAYLKKNPVRSGAVYLSLGDREEKAKNQVMATVGDRIRGIHAQLETEGIRTVLEWNPGNHFRDADIRTAKAFAWVINNLE